MKYRTARLQRTNTVHQDSSILYCQISSVWCDVFNNMNAVTAIFFADIYEKYINGKFVSLKFAKMGKCIPIETHKSVFTQRNEWPVKYITIKAEVWYIYVQQ